MVINEYDIQKINERFEILSEALITLTKRVEELEKEMEGEK